MPVKLLVVDDHEVIRTGIVDLLSGSTVKVVAEASTNAEAIKMAAKHRPDVILLDIRLSGEDGLEAIKRLKKAVPKASVIIFSIFDNPTYIARAIALGAADYLLKGSSLSDLLKVINAAAEGKSPSSVGALKKVADVLARQQAVKIDNSRFGLTSRETQVLRHVAFGLSNQEVADALKIRLDTVKEHVQNILRKIGATHRTQAALWALKKGLVE
jgi:DNA-binding NarL/FixJ family response regulator